MCRSVDYYNSNAERYLIDTENADMSRLYVMFEKYLKPGDTILDIGCGSGRDSKYFAEKNYNVYAHDGSEAMVAHAKKQLGDKVAHCYFEDFDPVKLFQHAIFFDGLWACSTLLHVKEEDLVGVINHYTDYLKDGGVFFMSFKKREENHEKDGRIFTNFTRPKLEQMLAKCNGLEILEALETTDVREGRANEGWISVTVRKR